MRVHFLREVRAVRDAGGAESSANPDQSFFRVAGLAYQVEAIAPQREEGALDDLVPVGLSWATSSAIALAGLAPLQVGVGKPGGRGVDDVVQQVRGGRLSAVPEDRG